jgi:hypothetical protein
MMLWRCAAVRLTADYFIRCAGCPRFFCILAGLCEERSGVDG